MVLQLDLAENVLLCEGESMHSVDPAGELICYNKDWP